MDKPPHVCAWRKARRDRRRKCAGVEQELSRGRTSDQNSDRSHGAGPPPTSRQVVDSSDSRVGAGSSRRDKNLSLCLKEFCTVVDGAIWERGGLAPLAAAAASARLSSPAFGFVSAGFSVGLGSFFFFVRSLKRKKTLACSTPHGQLMGCPLNEIDGDSAQGEISLLIDAKLPLCARKRKRRLRSSPLTFWFVVKRSMSQS